MFCMKFTMFQLKRKKNSNEFPESIIKNCKKIIKKKKNKKKIVKINLEGQFRPSKFIVIFFLFFLLNYYYKPGFFNFFFHYYYYKHSFFPFLLFFTDYL